MKKFIEWLQEHDAQTGTQIKNAFKSMGDGMREGADEKATEYAKRILAGESPDVVMQGFIPNGAMWNSVMKRVQELQQANKNQQMKSPTAQPQPEQFSISSLENKLGLRNGSLAVDMSKDKNLAFVRNRLNGKSISTQPTPQHIEQAAKKLFSII